MSGADPVLPPAAMAALQDEADCARMQIAAGGRNAYVLALAFEAAAGGMARSSTDGWSVSQTRMVAERLEDEAGRLREMARTAAAAARQARGDPA